MYSLESDLIIAKKDGSSQWVSYPASTVNVVSNVLRHSGFSGFSLFSVTDRSTPLPLTLISFNARRSTGPNILTWVTAQETNTDHFIVQRSPDALQFEEIGRVTASGFHTATSTYSFEDEHMIEAARFYRLAMVDRDGSRRFSNVVELDDPEQADQWSVYPNPVRDILYLESPEDSIQVSIVNSEGLLVYQNTFYGRSSSVDLSNIHSLPAGMYYLNLMGETGARHFKLIRLQ
jgi:hypothetical protein